ncbi:hypothetical protein OF117_21765 [Geodermatophilus sp. YIM 151500]|uniref:hypothetical protein n=1 Tax=Geodermatophilus sp. YIM 151500 TaxID=2984531 RepID=UPI0021E4AA07|nr:hypothetical protein [Geodermatophilus sp. YIM 151500]MCV2491979.1 hypothetical protein [Geodermatophilus sp. YIM 151500]
MSENDPDPYIPAEEQPKPELGGVPQPDAGDPTRGGKRGQIGEAPSVASDEPDDGTTYPVGGGRVAEETDAPPVADPGPDA